MRILALLGGLAAVGWLARERIAHLVLPREPEPPSPVPPPPLPPDDLTAIKGIGPTYASRLEAAGLTRYADLVAAGPEEVAAVLGISARRAADLVEQARGLARAR